MSSVKMTIDVGTQDLCSFHTEEGIDKLRDRGGVRAVCNMIKVDPEQGIKADEVAYRREQFGENRVPEKPPKTYLQYIQEAMEDFTLRLLCGCAILSIIIAVAFQREEELSWLEGVAILVTVIAVCNIQAVQDWNKERSYRKMNAISNNMNVDVIRDGKRQEISRYEVVVGDIIAISVGDVLEVDGILIQGSDVEVDESAFTGEPEDIKKDIDEAPLLFSGTAVKNGTGIYVATAVGTNSVAGRITALVRGQKVAKSTGSDAAPLEVKDVGPKDIEEGKVTELNTPDENDTVPLGTAENRAKEDGKNGTKTVEDDEEGEGEGGSVLRIKLDKMVGRIAYFAFGSASISTVVMLVRYVIDNHISAESDWDWKDDPGKILEAVATGIAIVVVAVPEGLPLAVTLALTLSMKNMVKDMNHVKHLDATETMGSATTICSDKTGTLTQNRMTVVRAFCGGKEFAGEYASDRTCGKLFKGSWPSKLEEFEKEKQKSDKVYSKNGDKGEALDTLLCENIVATKADGAEISWNTTTSLWEQKSNKTDCALLAFADDLGIKYQELRNKDSYQVLDKEGRKNYGLKMFTFSSSRKRSAQALPLTKNPEGPCRIYVKGASEIILRLCDKEMAIDGSTTPMDSNRCNEIQNDVVEKFACQAFRTIALAYRDFDKPPEWDDEVDAMEAVRLTGLEARTFEVETKLTFLGIFGIFDPIRDGVPRAIRQCNGAGVDVRMVTGDHKATAIAIAKECGILRPGKDFDEKAGGKLVHNDIVLEGFEFRARVLKDGKLDQAAFDAIWPHLRVLARSSPEDKHTLVSGLCESELYSTDQGRALGIHPEPQVVAVTGDGTNDAPALRRADVGFAMKLTGTQVAQDAADILLMDDNFESVVKACMWGRNVYDSIAKFLQFQLTVNVSAVTIALVGACTVRRSPLSVVQMLWVNLIMDSLGALALASEPPTENLLDRQPYGKNRGLISYAMVWNILGQSVYQLIVLFTILFGGAGPGLWGTEDPDSYFFKPGGMLDIPSGIGRDQHAPPTQHYTLIFNCFVFMQLFNWLNCRKLNHEFNVLAGVQNNISFCVIWLTCLVVQVVMVEIAALGGGTGENKGFKTRALSTDQWLVCVICGVFSMGWYLVVAALGKALKPTILKGATDAAIF
jgi:Ca2+ transporting ATPase